MAGVRLADLELDLELDLGIECFTDPQGGGGMKNIQVIDGALNCTFTIFQAAERVCIAVS
jgi:hypothetical protein